MLLLLLWPLPSVSLTVDMPVAVLVVFVGGFVYCRVVVGVVVDVVVVMAVVVAVAVDMVVVMDMVVAIGVVFVAVAVAVGV